MLSSLILLQEILSHGVRTITTASIQALGVSAR
ncbi:Uncharacterised protein [Bordetella pertussis]|nr:Uncharacterised protein [Bordetella pertussis]